MGPLERSLQKRHSRESSNICFGTSSEIVFSKVNRREMLAASAVFALAGIPRSLWALEQDEELIDFDDLTGFRTELRDANPRVRCFDLRQLTSSLTPEDHFYTFHQTQTVQANAAEWRLRVGGL